MSLRIFKSQSSWTSRSFLRQPSSFVFSRFNSTASTTTSASTPTLAKEETKADNEGVGIAQPSKKKRSQARPTINKVGVPFEPFIPLRYSRFPSPFSSPRKCFKALLKRLYLFCFNWVQVYQFKGGMGKGYKPNFLKWKNEAIENFVKVNKAFAERKIENVRPYISEYVFFALAKRQNQLPKNVSLNWDLVKFNSKPKLVSFNAFPHEDGSTLLCQIVYQFNTKQRLTLKKRGEKEFKEEIKDLTEYLAFNINPYSDEVALAGSVFESPLERELQPKQMASQQATINFMIKNGDIYRIEPTEEEKLAASKPDE